MAKIDLFPTDVSGLLLKLSIVANGMDMASFYAAKASKLEMKVAANNSISLKIAGLKTKSNTYRESSVFLREMIKTSVEEFQAEDSALEESTTSLLDQIKSALSGAASAIKSFFSTLSINRQASINSVFLTSASILTFVSTVSEWVKKITEKIKNYFSGEQTEDGDDDDNGDKNDDDNGNGDDDGNDDENGDGDGDGNDDENGDGDGNENDDGGPEPEQVTYIGCEKYNSSEYASVAYKNNDYSDYMILTNMDPSYSVEQTTNVSCTGTADACAAAIAGKISSDELSKYAGKTGFRFTTRVEGSYNWTAEEVLQKAYDQVVSGNPTIIGVYSKSGHSVTVVGIRQGANRESLTDADFLIMDPADGKIKTIEDYGNQKNAYEYLKDKDWASPGTCVMTDNIDADKKYANNGRSGIRVLES